MRCPNCGSENPAGLQFCEECGTQLVPVCPSCGHEVRPTAKFCGTCGTALGGLSRVPSREARGQKPADVDLSTADESPQTLNARGERRQLTVLFCDLVGSTALSTHLDPEDLRAVIRHYQQTCAAVIQRHDGHIAQYLGDGLLVYFGYPTAHEDDARRAVRAGLEIVRALQSLAARPEVPSPFQGEGQGEGSAVAQSHSPHPSPLLKGARGLAVRIGIHTGLVVIGDIGTSGRTEHLAVGETPNIAARMQGVAEPNTVIISAATHRLIEGQFDCQPFGSHLLKGIEVPIAVYHVQSERQSTSLLVGKTALTPLVGREQEVGLLIDRWEQAKEGRGQVVLLSGEPGIGKSRLAHTLREHVTAEGSLLFEACCSPYHQHSAFYPLIEVLQRTLLFTRQDTDVEKVTKLEGALALYELQPAVPLFTALLSLPTPSTYPPLTFTPQKQKERTLEALLQLLGAQAERQATVTVWEDVHWADPSSLEFLTLLIEQLPTSKLMLVVTFRPEFTPPWKPRSHISQLVLNRLGKRQVEVMIEKAAAGQELSAEVIEQIRLKTDGVPLFVEELTKSVVEAREHGEKSIGALAIPATLQEALLARLDRLSEARQVAQLGATIGREFSHELLQAVTSLSEEALHAALAKLVEAEILYQRGIGEQARYFFKHALIQDTAYQSLLKSTRQHYHQQIAQMLEERFPDTKDTQPELLAHHYTEGGFIAQAIPYWQQAGERTRQRSAYVEAITHVTTALKLLETLPCTPERDRQELMLQVALGPPLIATKGYGVLEVEHAYTRARELCRQIGETPLIFPVLWGLAVFYMIRAQHQTACEVGEQLLRLAESEQDRVLLLQAHLALGFPLLWLGDLGPAESHLAEAAKLYDPLRDYSSASFYGQHSAVVGLSYEAWALWQLGYPQQALERSQASLRVMENLSHPFSLAMALCHAARFHQLCREEHAAQEQAERVILLAREQGFPFWEAQGTIVRGWALAEQGHVEEGIEQIQQGLSARKVAGGEVARPWYLAMLAEAYGKASQTEEGLAVLAEGLAHAEETGGRFYEAELYRLKGEFTLQKLSFLSSQLSVTDPRPPAPDPQGEAEACFLQAIDIAQQQHAKSLELRAAMSLARLWQQQDKRAEAHKLLSEVYHWFTEGFDTKDLQEAKALLAELQQ